MSNRTPTVAAERKEAVALSPREAAPAWAALLVLAVLCWIITIDQARMMGNGVGTMGMALLPFVAMWTVMMAAMMFPALAPVGILWSKSILRLSSGTVRTVRLSLFVGGYLLAWAATGLVAYGGFAVFERLLSALPQQAGFLGAAVFVAAGIYQLSPLKNLCLRHCRSPMAFLAHFTGLRGPVVDLRVGLYHGLYCIGCCWGLMVIMVAVGVMNIGAMAALSAIIFFEKIWRRGPFLARVTGYVFILLALLTMIVPTLFPGLNVGQM